MPQQSPTLTKNTKLYRNLLWRMFSELKKTLIKIISSNNKRTHHLAKNKHWKQNIKTANFN